MNCMNCGAFLVDKDLDYCPKCGCNVLIQKKVDYLSRQYYNRGLEKASVRDLSGAIDCLKQSLIIISITFRREIFLDWYILRQGRWLPHSANG